MIILCIACDCVTGPIQSIAAYKCEMHCLCLSTTVVDQVNVPQQQVVGFLSFDSLPSVPFSVFPHQRLISIHPVMPNMNSVN